MSKKNATITKIRQKTAGQANVSRKKAAEF
jgi:hypothetical protein